MSGNGAAASGAAERKDGAKPRSKSGGRRGRGRSKGPRGPPKPLGKNPPPPVLSLRALMKTDKKTRSDQYENSNISRGLVKRAQRIRLDADLAVEAIRAGTRALARARSDAAAFMNDPAVKSAGYNPTVENDKDEKVGGTGVLGITLASAQDIALEADTRGLHQRLLEWKETSRAPKVDDDGKFVTREVREKDKDGKETGTKKTVKEWKETKYAGRNVFAEFLRRSRRQTMPLAGVGRGRGRSNSKKRGIKGVGKGRGRSNSKKRGIKGAGRGGSRPRSQSQPRTQRAANMGPGYGME